MLLRTEIFQKNIVIKLQRQFDLQLLVSNDYKT